MFDYQEAAIGHALSAKAMLKTYGTFGGESSLAAPVFIASLYQSLEISLKFYAAEMELVESVGAFRGRKFRKQNDICGGHDIDGIYKFVFNALMAERGLNFIHRLRAFLSQGEQGTLVTMALGDEGMAPTRRAYRRRQLGYLEIRSGDLQYMSHMDDWVDGVFNLANGLSDLIAADRKAIAHE